MSATDLGVAWLDRLAEEAGAKVEIDAEGSVIVSPATDEHWFAASALVAQLIAACPRRLWSLVPRVRRGPRSAD